MRIAVLASGPRVHRGLTLLQFALSAAIIATLGGIFLGVVLYYEELGEKTEVELTILNIRSGLRYQIAERMFSGRMHELEALSGVNPVQWLQRPPADYEGERYDTDAGAIGKGRWYFDVDRKELRYRPRLRSHLSPERDPLRWRVVPIYGPGNPRTVESLALIGVEPYRWF